MGRLSSPDLEELASASPWPGSAKERAQEDGLARPVTLLLPLGYIRCAHPGPLRIEPLKANKYPTGFLKKKIQLVASGFFEDFFFD
jgi:hypothetical protein